MDQPRHPGVSPGLRTGVIGAGAMGFGIALSLQRAGSAVHVRDIDPAREQLARERGMQVHASAAALGRVCDVIFIVVVDAAQIDAVLDGSDGLLAVLGPGKLVLTCSTISPEDAESIAARVIRTGAAAIDAPISGGPARAEQGSMSMMLAGPASALDAAAPVVAAVSGRHFVIGPIPGSASKAKLVNNLLAGIHLAAAAEAIALAERLGLDATQMADLIHASSGQSWMFDDRIPRAIAGDLHPRAQTRVLEKDLTLVGAVAARAGVVLPLGRAALDRFEAACADGWSLHDDASLLAHYRSAFAARNP